MGFLSKLFGKGENKDSDELWGMVSDDADVGMTLEAARAAQEAAMAKLGDVSEVNQQINEAALLMTAGDFQGSIDAYCAIAKAHPVEKGLCESQIGAAEYFLGNYDKAIAHYEEAKRLGANASDMDENIAEAREALAS